MLDHTKCGNVLYLHLSFCDDRMEEAQIIFIKQKNKKARQKNSAQMMFFAFKAILACRSARPLTRVVREAPLSETDRWSQILSAGEVRLLYNQSSET